jgi:hypothetical protein
MSCRDVQRAVAELCFFGEQDALTSPHLEHLSGCASCRETAGLDRAIVRELRRALAARVEGHLPSEQAWSAVLRRTQQAPATPLWRQAQLRLGFGTGGAGVVGKLRTASAVASLMLAAVMANGQNSIPTLPSGPPQSATNPGDQFERSAALPAAVPIRLRPIEPLGPPPPPPDAEERLRIALAQRSAPPIENDAGPGQHEPEDDEAAVPRVMWHLYPPGLDPAAVGGPAADQGNPAGPSEPVRSVPGQPS